jgi:hypothetical protein
MGNAAENSAPTENEPEPASTVSDVDF